MPHRRLNPDHGLTVLKVEMPPRQVARCIDTLGMMMQHWTRTRERPTDAAGILAACEPERFAAEFLTELLLSLQTQKRT